MLIMKLSVKGLKNMMSDTTKVPIKATEELVPKLPFNINDGVKRTVIWISENG